MTEPERALERARAAVASMRAEGAYPSEQSAAQRQPSAGITTDRLLEWALIEPDLRNVRSTRRLGAPLTALKRGLLRLLAQYHAELIAEQTRVNVSLVLYVRELEQRVAELERGLGREPEPPAQ
jgi:hypothetical protein